MPNPPSYFETPASSRFKGIFSWLLTTDHKRIAVLYMAAVLFWFLLAVFLGLAIRTELMTAGSTIMSAESYNAVFTLHGVIMIFLFIIPGMPAIFGNFLVPIQIGASDVFFPKLNLLSWYLYMAGGITAIIALFLGGPPDTGWTFYVPFSMASEQGISLTLFAVFILGFSSMLTALNMITTIHRMRRRKMTMMRMPLFCWAIYSTSWIQLLATPILAITALVVIFERMFGAGIFDPTRGGDPLLYQHLFWMYSHPAVYIMILPGMGIISELFTVFSRKSIFGYKALVYMSLGIAFLGSLVWAHHMFTSGMSDVAVLVFSFLTYLVAVPSAVKVFSWIATMYRGSIHMTPPFFFALCFIVLFSIGGLSGLVLGSASSNVHVHDTHFVVAHFHFVMFGGAGFAFIGGLHFWWPKIFGRMFNFRAAYTGAMMLASGFMIHYTPMFIMGLQGLPRRYFDYVPQFEPGNFFSGVGAYIMVAGILMLAVNLAVSLRNGIPAPDNPWDGATLEWTIPSPPPHHNFTDQPPIRDFPYDYEGIIPQKDK